MKKICCFFYLLKQKRIADHLLENPEDMCYTTFLTVPMVMLNLLLSYLVIDMGPDYLNGSLHTPSDHEQDA